MRMLLLPFFVIRLVLANSSFIALFGHDLLQKYKSLLLIMTISLFFLLVGLLNNSLGTIISLNKQTTRVAFSQQTYPLVVLNNTPEKSVSTITKNAVSLTELSENNKELLQRYPTHRDLLINQLLLSLYLDKTADAELVRESLKNLDPNNDLVKKITQ